MSEEQDKNVQIENAAQHFPEDSHAPQPQTQNSKHQTDMEVHKHPHHVMHSKKWHEYALEFLMLFLAVFLGFVAENVRENVTDRKKENEFMKSLVKDLESDTLTYADYAKNNAAIYASIDTLTAIMNGSERNTQLSKIYFLARTLSLKLLLHFPTTRTYDQMKSSGQLRLIHKSEVADSIGSYYNSLQIMNSFNDVLLTHDYDYMRLMGKVFNAGILLKILKERKEPSDHQPVKLLTEDPVTINELLTAAQYIYGTLQLAQNITLQRKHTAENLIQQIKQEYHLENE